MTEATTTTVIDPVAAARASAEAELTSLVGEHALYSKARSTVQKRIAEIETADLRPLEDALHELASKIDTAKSRIALAEYLALGPTDDRRREAFALVQNAAVQAKVRALASPAGTNLGAVIHATFDRAARAWQNSALKLTMPGSTYTEAQRAADFLATFQNLKAELDRLAALSPEEKINLADQYRNAG